MNELFSKEWWGKVLTTEEKWKNISCEKCNIKMILEEENNFESIKICPKCREKIILIKK